MEAPKNNIPYHRWLKKTLAALPKDKKPRLLFHVCCGPCACYPLVFLAPYFDITIYYANSNIYPEAEYQKRLETLKELLSYIKRDHGHDIALVVPPYDNVSYMAKLEPYKDLPEGSERCFTCYRLRMEEAYAYAEEHGYDYFTTVMTVSRQKNSQKLNQIGAELQERYPKTKYLFSDFKKDKGLEIGTEIRKGYGLYNQDYCGCPYSLAEAEIRAQKKPKI